MLNIVRLRVLRELHHRKTLSADAEALSYSTSAVSQQVRLLEKEVGVPLVEPAGRRLQLTAQGLILVAHAEQILDLLERAEADVSTSMEQPRGTVRIAAFQSAALTIVPRALQELRRLHGRTYGDNNPGRSPVADHGRSHRTDHRPGREHHLPAGRRHLGRRKSSVPPRTSRSPCASSKPVSPLPSSPALHSQKQRPTCAAFPQRLAYRAGKCSWRPGMPQANVQPSLPLPTHCS
ncbi:MAG: LysR family transcriptional regulator, partial [Arthrobacter sp.]